MSAYPWMDEKKNNPLPSKIDQLVDDAKTQLNRAGIETDGKRSDEILKMAREERKCGIGLMMFISSFLVNRFHLSSLEWRYSPFWC